MMCCGTNNALAAKPTCTWILALPGRPATCRRLIRLLVLVKPDRQNTLRQVFRNSAAVPPLRESIEDFLCNFTVLRKLVVPVYNVRHARLCQLERLKVI